MSTAKNAAILIKRLQETSSRLEKEKLIELAWDAGERIFFMGILLAYDKLITFGVKKVVEIEGENDADFTPTFTYEEFDLLAKQLRERKLTGHAARDAIIAAAESCDTNEWNYFYRRVLLKDFACGISETTVNKILKKAAKKNKTAEKFIVQSFDCQLAQKSEDNPSKMKGKKYLDVKYDGGRILTLMDIENKLVQQFSRNGNENDNFTVIVSGLTELLPELPGSVVLDGEMTGKNFQALMSQFNRKSDVKTDECVYKVFDIIPLEEFRRGKSTASQRERHKALCAMVPLFQKYTNNKVQVLPKKEIDLSSPTGMAELEQFNKEVLEMAVDDEVIEGIMIKDPNAIYECKRTVHWLKMKPWITVDLEIVGFEEGTGENKGSLGALVCEGYDESERHIIVNVGSGYTDEQRIDMWKNQDKYIKMIVEVKGDKLSKSKTDDGIWSVRFPTLNCFRGNKPGEKN